MAPLTQIGGGGPAGTCTDFFKGGEMPPLKQNCNFGDLAAYDGAPRGGRAAPHLTQNYGNFEFILLAEIPAGDLDEFFKF